MAISSSDPDHHHAAEEASRKRKRGGSSSSTAPTRWRSESEQRTYSSKLLEALRRVGRSAPLAPRARTVRAAADRALAAAARGRSRWSRAVLLAGRRNLRLRSRRRRATPAAAAIGSDRANGFRSVRKPVPVLEKKAKVLGRLVPGCRTLAFPTLLEEASDYIAALEMQVRAMSALAEVLLASGTVA